VRRQLFTQVSAATHSIWCDHSVGPVAHARRRFEFGAAFIPKGTVGKEKRRRRGWHAMPSLTPRPLPIVPHATWVQSCHAAVPAHSKFGVRRQLFTQVSAATHSIWCDHSVGPVAHTRRRFGFGAAFIPKGTVGKGKRRRRGWHAMPSLTPRPLPIVPHATWVQSCHAAVPAHSKFGVRRQLFTQVSAATHSIWCDHSVGPVAHIRRRFGFAAPFTPKAPWAKESAVAAAGTQRRA